MYEKYKSELLRSTVLLIVITSIISIIISVLDFVVPIMLSNFIDNYKSNKELLGFVAKLFIFYIISYMSKMLLNNIFKNYAIKFKTKEHMRLLNFMFQMKYSQLNKCEPTYLVERITMCVNTLYDVYAETISQFIISILSIVIAIAISFSVNKPIAMVFLVLIPIQILGYKKINSALGNKCIVLQKVVADSFKNILSVTSNVDFIKQTGDNKKILKILTPFVEGIHKENASVNKFAKDISTTLNQVITIFHNLIYILAAFFMISKQITPAQFVLISMLAGLYNSNLSNIVKVNVNLRDMKGVNEFIEKEIMYNVEEDGEQEISDIKTVEFDIQNLGYEDATLIEKGQFMAEKGDVVMISGESGTGKTTLMKGLIKFLHCDTISVNGINVKEVQNRSLRNRVSFFSQNIPIISGSIRDNVTMGEDISIETFNALKKHAYLQKFYDLPKGLDTKVLENGSNLSGGDKQKIALARLYIENPDIIILDESTNSIDEENSYRIIKDIVEDFKDKIIFIISHDSYIKTFCNKIVTIKDKQIYMEKQDITGTLGLKLTQSSTNLA